VPASTLKMAPKLYFSVKTMLLFFVLFISPLLFNYHSIIAEEHNDDNEEFLSSDCSNGASFKDQSVGCVGRSLIPADESYWIEFKDEHEISAQNCLLTCQTVYPNTSLALVYMELDNESATPEKMSLDCRCAMSSAIIKKFVGPEIFCDPKCQVSSESTLACGGKHQFSDGGSETFYSVYCLNNVTVSPTTINPPAPGPTTTTTIITTTTTITVTPQTTTTETPHQGNPIKVLRAILSSLVSANISSIVMIGLLVMVIILVVILVIWFHLFLQSQEPSANARFYNNAQGSRRSPATVQGEGTTKDPIMAGADKTNNKESYGTANQAFDPHSELDDISHGSFQVNGATLKVTTSSEEEEEEDSVTPRAVSPVEFFTQEGRSTFYHGNSDPKYILDTVSTASEESEEIKNNSKE